jgi:hypothetical protein
MPALLATTALAFGARNSFGKRFLATITTDFLIHDRDSIFSVQRGQWYHSPAA